MAARPPPSARGRATREDGGLRARWDEQLKGARPHTATLRPNRPIDCASTMNGSLYTQKQCMRVGGGRLIKSRCDTPPRHGRRQTRRRVCGAVSRHNSSAGGRGRPPALVVLAALSGGCAHVCVQTGCCGDRNAGIAWWRAPSGCIEAGKSCAHCIHGCRLHAAGQNISLSWGHCAAWCGRLRCCRLCPQSIVRAACPLTRRPSV